MNVLSLIQLYASYALVYTMCHHSMIGHNVLNVHLGTTRHVIQMNQTYATTANHSHVYVI